ncbi:MAG: MerR family transcriptional regulator [Oscillospiraceae bacterium]|nr:MerR family transcriptional regulator [Oscillospiraceae bacterium]
MEWTIKQATQKTGISTDTLRYYDKEGILSPNRRENGYRYYDETDITMLKHIAVMKYAQFSLAEMKRMGELFRKEPSAACNATGKSVLHTKIAQLNQAICNYQKIVKLMEAVSAMMDSADEYLRNKDSINGFIDQIFDDIRCSDSFDISAIQVKE